MDLPRVIASTVFAITRDYRRGHGGFRPALLVLARDDVYDILERTVTWRTASWTVTGRSMRVCGYPVALDATGHLTVADPGWCVEFTVS